MFKYLRGVFAAETVNFCDYIFPAPGAMPYLHYISELTYPLCGSAFTNTADNPSEMCPLKLADFLPVFVPSIVYNLTGAAYSPNGFHRLL